MPKLKDRGIIALLPRSVCVGLVLSDFAERMSRRGAASGAEKWKGQVPGLDYCG